MKTICGITFDEKRVHELASEADVIGSVEKLMRSEDFSDLADSNNFDEIFNRWERTGRLKCLLVAFFLEAEIPFLNYMTHIPQNMFGVNTDKQVFVSSIEIPNNIKKINVIISTLTYKLIDDMNSIILPLEFELEKGNIGDYLVRSNISYNYEVCRGFAHSGKIFYPGTKEQLEKQLPHTGSVNHYFIITCSDGEYEWRY